MLTFSQASINVQPASQPVRTNIENDLWVMVVGGIPYGVVVAGLGSRLAMYVLRVTSPESVNGRISDDGFVIGRFTASGTYNLMVLGAFVGVLGAATYLMVNPWLIGPPWFRRLTIGLSSSVVVGSMLVHADGIDFNVLKPKWLAIGLFVALPGIFGLFIGPVIDRVRRRSSVPRTRPVRWVLPLVLVAMFVPVAFLLAFLTVGVVGFHLVGRFGFVHQVRQSRPYGLAVRSVWLSFAGLGLVALIQDIDNLT